VYSEYPHEINVIRQGGLIEDESGGFVESEPVKLFGMKAFVDTPSSYEEYVAMQKQNPFDRYMLYPYRTDITSDMYIEYEEVLYEIVGKPRDQGGWHEVMRVKLREVKK